MSPKPQIESERMLWDLYCVTMKDFNPLIISRESNCVTMTDFNP